EAVGEGKSGERGAVAGVRGRPGVDPKKESGRLRPPAGGQGSRYGGGDGRRGRGRGGGRSDDRRGRRDGQDHQCLRVRARGDGVRGTAGETRTRGGPVRATEAHKSGTNCEAAWFSPVVYRPPAPDSLHHQAWKWCVGPWPEPILMRFAAASAAVT